jgi:hypothetical protein
VHLHETHPGQPPNFGVKILSKTNGCVERKSTEALWVHKMDPVMNRRQEGRGTVDLNIEHLNLQW